MSINLAKFTTVKKTSLSGYPFSNILRGLFLKTFHVLSQLIIRYKEGVRTFTFYL